MNSKIMIVTGEASGDLHGANLVRALQTKRADLTFYGMGGPELESLGVEILFDSTDNSINVSIELNGPMEVEIFELTAKDSPSRVVFDFRRTIE